LCYASCAKDEFDDRSSSEVKCVPIPKTVEELNGQEGYLAKSAMKYLLQKSAPPFADFD